MRIAVRTYVVCARHCFSAAHVARYVDMHQIGKVTISHILPGIHNKLLRRIIPSIADRNDPVRCAALLRPMALLPRRTVVVVGCKVS